MHRTAMVRKDISRPMKWILEHEDFSGSDVLHYGEGRAYPDTEALFEKSYFVDVYEPYPHESEQWKSILPGAHYDVLVSIYVLNVLMPESRESVIADMTSHADRAIVAVRTDKIRGRKFLDGVLTAAGTFQKSFSKEDAESLGKVLTYNSSFAIVEL